MPLPPRPAATAPGPRTRQHWTPPAGRPPLPARLMRNTWRGLPPRRHAVGWEPGLPVPAADGSPLLTDHYFPRERGDFPTLLVRTPYGRGLPWSPLYGLLFAEQGFHVVVQSCRGTGGSGGAFHLWRNEPADGQAAVEWLRGQPWFDGRLATIGPSYLGYTQWALALDPPPELKAMVVQLGLHDPHGCYHAGGVPNLDTMLAGGTAMAFQHRGVLALVRAMLRLQRRLGAVTTARPLRGAHRDALGEIPWLEEVMDRPDPDDAFWDGADLAPSLDRVAVPTALVTGWHDLLAEQSLEQYRRLRRAGCDVSLLAGPWTHASALGQGLPDVFADALAWLRAHLRDDPSGLRPTPVRVHVGGAQEWRDLADWPAEPPAATAWYAAPGGALTAYPPTDGQEPLASLRHDPGDPAPSVGGRLLSRTAGARDTRAAEAREDVLVFTGPPLQEAVEVIGPVTARMTVSTDTGHTDVFARLCDVAPDGRSVNVCDGIAPVRADPGRPAGVRVALGSTAHRFEPGHRIRWQVAAAAHPRYALNPGTGEPRLDATEFLPIRLTVHAASALLLPEAGAAGPATPSPGASAGPAVGGRGDG